MECPLHPPLTTLDIILPPPKQPILEMPNQFVSNVDAFLFIYEETFPSLVL